MEKYEFSRDDYLMYKEFFENRLDKIEVVSKDVVYQKHDKTFKDILKSKKEMSKFLEQFIGLEVREEELEKYKKYEIKLKYQLIDINKYSKEELLNRKTKMASMMLIEKYQTSEEIKNILIEILGKVKDKERILWLRDVIEYVLPDTLKKQKEEIIKIIDRREVNNMEEWLKRVRRNDAKIRKNLIKKGVLDTVKRMIKMNLDVEFIKQATGAQEKEIEKMKREICNE